MNCPRDLKYHAANYIQGHVDAPRLLLNAHSARKCVQATAILPQLYMISLAQHHHKPPLCSVILEVSVEEAKFTCF